MSTPDFEVHRAIVHYSNPSTGEAQVRIPALLGSDKVVDIPTTGLTSTDGFWNVPSIGTSTFIAVSHCRTHFLWLTAIGASGSGGNSPSNEPIGHEDRTGSYIAFDNATRTFSIQPAVSSYVVWCVGNRYEKTFTESVTIPNTTGLYYIYFDPQGELQYRTSYFLWDQDCPTAYIYWNSATQKAEFFADERHGITMDWQTHEYLHRTRGSAYANGFDVSNFDVSTQTGSTDAQAQLDIDNGTFFDEDLQVDVRHSLSPSTNTWEQQLQGPASIPVLYRSGAGYVYDAPTNFPVKQGTSHPVYNSVSGGSWGTTELGANSYGIQWIVATNQLNYPVLSIMGQDQYANIGQAEAVSWTGMDLDGLPVVEIRVLYKIILRATGSNTPGCYFVQIADYRTSVESSTSTASAVTDHGDLSGLSGDDHPQYALADGSRGSFEASGAVSTHEAATDPHPQYLTATEGNAAYEASGAVSIHNSATTNIHGIADTSALLDTGDIGVSVQGYSSVLAATTASYTTAEETKLAGIAAGAEVNTVDSVNSQTGAVVLDADDIDDTATTHKFVTASDLTNLSNLSGTNTGDQDLSSYQLQPAEGAFANGDKTKLDGIAAGAEVNTVDSVNSQTGAVVLDADNIDDTSTTNKFVTASDITNLSNLSGINTGDQDLSPYQLAPVEGAFVDGDKTKLDGIEANADVTDATNVESAIESITLTSVSGDNGDEVLIIDATDGGLKSVLWEDMPFGSGGVTDHGGLTGLNDDDHPQYLLKSSTTNFPTTLDTGLPDSIEALQAKVGVDGSAVTTSHDYKIAQLEAKSPTITLSGDASGSTTLTNLGNGTLSVTVNDDSHNHTIANVDNLQATLDSIGSVLISTTNIGTNVSSVAVANCFSSTYSHYIVILSCDSGNSTNTDIFLTLDSVNQSYAYVNVEDPNYSNTPVIARSSSSAAMGVGSQIGSSSSDTCPATRIEIFDPYDSLTQTKFSFASPSKWAHSTGGGVHLFKQSSTGFSIFPNTGTWSGGTVRVYGVKK